MAWLNLTMPNQTVKNDLKAKKTKLPQIFFLLAPFVLQNFKKILAADPELCAIFGPKMTHLQWTIFF